MILYFHIKSEPSPQPTCLDFQASAHHLLGHAARLSGETAAHAAVQRQPVGALVCRDTNTVNNEQILDINTHFSPNETVPQRQLHVTAD